MLLGALISIRDLIMPKQILENAWKFHNLCADWYLSLGTEHVAAHLQIGSLEVSNDCFCLCKYK